MIALTELEAIAAICGNPYTQSLSVYQRQKHLEQVESEHSIELTSDERKAVLARADEYHTARIENRPVAPLQAKILQFRPRDALK